MITAVKPVNRLPVVPPTEPEPVYYDSIYLAHDEWENDTMERIAREWFDKHPDCQFVRVHEHAGWCLGWRRDGSVWSTANDRAVLKPGTFPTHPNRVCRRETGACYSLVTGEGLSKS